MVRLFYALCGACIASFAECLSGMLKEGHWQRCSRCDHCGARLQALEMIPVLSWIFLRGHCRCRREKLPCLYPLSELCGALLLLPLSLSTDLKQNAAMILLFVFLLVLSLEDLHSQQIHSLFTCLFLLCALFALPLAGIRSHLPGTILLCAGLFLLRKLSGGIGDGDIEFLAAAGLLLGLRGTLCLLLFSCLSALPFAYRKRNGRIAFMPVLCFWMWLFLLHIFVFRFDLLDQLLDALTLL